MKSNIQKHRNNLKINLKNDRNEKIWLSEVRINMNFILIYHNVSVMVQIHNYAYIKNGKQQVK
jgi:hypothetical protein